MFVVAFLCGGLLVGEVKASGHIVNSNDTAEASKALSLKTFKAEFNRKYTKLKKFCMNNIGPDCDDAIGVADEAAQTAWSECLRNMNVCQAQQNLAIATLEWAMAVCRAEEPIIVIAVHSQKTESRTTQRFLS